MDMILYYPNILNLCFLVVFDLMQAKETVDPNLPACVMRSL